MCASPHRSSRVTSLRHFPGAMSGGGCWPRMPGLVQHWRLGRGDSTRWAARSNAHDRSRSSPKYTLPPAQPPGVVPMIRPGRLRPTLMLPIPAPLSRAVRTAPPLGQTFLGRFLASLNGWGGDWVADTTTLGCYSTDVDCIVDRAAISNDVSARGSVQSCSASHPLKTLIHICTKKSHAGVHGLSDNVAAHRVDHAALTVVHITNPRGVVKEICGWPHEMVFGVRGGAIGRVRGPHTLLSNVGSDRDIFPRIYGVFHPECGVDLLRGGGGCLLSLPARPWSLPPVGTKAPMFWGGPPVLSVSLEIVVP